jgi:hypothetical protein
MAQAAVRGLPPLVAGLRSGAWRRRPSRPTLLAVAMLIVVAVPVPRRTIVPLVVDPAGGARVEIPVELLRDVPVGAAVDVRLRDEHLTRTATVHAVHLGPAPSRDRWDLDLDVAGAPYGGSHVGWARLHLGWASLSTRALGPLEPLLLRAWSWI